MAFIIKEIKRIEKILQVNSDEAMNMQEAINLVTNKNNSCRVIEINNYVDYKPISESDESNE